MTILSRVVGSVLLLSGAGIGWAVPAQHAQAAPVTRAVGATDAHPVPPTQFYSWHLLPAGGYELVPLDLDTLPDLGRPQLVILRPRFLTPTALLRAISRAVVPQKQVTSRRVGISRVNRPLPGVDAIFSLDSSGELDIFAFGYGLGPLRTLVDQLDVAPPGTAPNEPGRHPQPLHFGPMARRVTPGTSGSARLGIALD